MMIFGTIHTQTKCGHWSFTLVEVVLSIVIVAIGCWGIVYGYMMAAKQADLSGCSLAAQALAVQRLEQARSAKWDRLASPAIDELVSSNFPTVITNLDIPIISSVPKTMVSLTTSISWVTTNPPLKFIQVSCVWTNLMSLRIYTNLVSTYRAADE
jgi:type II secretory pathway pseudopilin PulG